MLDPIVIMGGPDDQKYPAKTTVRFSRGAPVLIAGDVSGDVYVFRLNSIDELMQLNNRIWTSNNRLSVYRNCYIPTVITKTQIGKSCLNINQHQCDFA
jgi:hypothetical protein